MFYFILLHSVFMIYIIITIHGSDDSIVFSIVAKLFLFVYFFLLKITHEPLHLAW